MTLNTSVAIHGAYDVRKVYDYCRALLNTPADVEPEISPTSIRNPPGLGLDAWLWVIHGADGPLLHTCETYCEPDDVEHTEWFPNDPTENGWAGIEVTFDTAYGYRDDRGEDCSALHARLVAQLGAWLDARGLDWKWQNEYTGEWFDRYDQLAQFAGAHTSTGADVWFRNVAMPAIALHSGGGA